MNFDGEYIHIGDADISQLKQLLGKLTPQHWLQDTSRQELYEVHSDTETIGLVWDSDFRHINPTKLPPLEVFGPSLQPLLSKVADYFESSEKWKSLFDINGHGYFIRANLVKLKAGGEITEHQDKNLSLAHSHRIHIPIITNDDVFFKIGETTINMLEGEIIELNNRLQHSVRNEGKDDRIHLILDWVVPGEQCCCSYKNHPGVSCDPQACMESDRLNIPCKCFAINQ